MFLAEIFLSILFCLTGSTVKLSAFFVGGVTRCRCGGQKISQRKLDAKFVFFKMRNEQTVWGDRADGLEKREVKPTPENQLHTASPLCLSLQRRCSRSPSQTPGCSENRKWTRMKKKQQQSVNMSWFQFNKDLFLECVWDSTYPRPLWWGRFGVCLCALVQSWGIAPHVAICWEASTHSKLRRVMMKCQ